MDMRLPTHCSSSIAVNTRHHQEVAAIEQRIMNIAASPLPNSIPVLVDLLHKLQPLIRLQKDVHILTDTRIGKAVHKLTKHPSPAIASLAKALISAWKKLLHHHSSSGSYEEKMQITKRKLAAGYERELLAKRQRTICLLQPEELWEQQLGHHHLVQKQQHTTLNPKPNILGRMRVAALSSSSKEKKQLQQHRGMITTTQRQEMNLRSLPPLDSIKSNNYKIINRR